MNVRTVVKECVPVRAFVSTVRCTTRINMSFEGRFTSTRDRSNYKKIRLCVASDACGNRSRKWKRLHTSKVIETAMRTSVTALPSVAN